MMSALTVLEPQVSLDDKYVAQEGRVLISGVQALVRLTLEQRRLDALRGHDTGVFVSGYQGSPLGGVDKEMARARRHLELRPEARQPRIHVSEMKPDLVSRPPLQPEVPFHTRRLPRSVPEF